MVNRLKIRRIVAATGLILLALIAGRTADARAGDHPLRGSDPLALAPAHAAPRAPGAVRYLPGTPDAGTGGGDFAQIGGRRDGGKDEPKAVEDLDRSNRVSPGRAMLYSLLLPGLGQQYCGRVERARVSYVLEGAIWASFAAFRVQSSHQQDRYIEFAHRSGGVDPAGKNDDYWRIIANYERSEGDAGSANEFVRRQARAQHPDDRAAQRAYEQAHGYFDDMAWDWQTSDNLARYKQLRGRSIDSRDRARYSVAAALVHRVISVIDAARVARLTNRAADGASGALEPRGQFGLALSGDPGTAVPLLTYRATF